MTIRVSARTLAYDNRPAANSAVISGKPPSARATRTWSLAVPGAIWHLHESQAAQEGISQSAHPCRASKSATNIRNWQVAAVRCPASSQIRASRRSIGIGAASLVVSDVMLEEVEVDVNISLMYSIPRTRI